jgi:3-oxoacyl-[acyl-carrier-protein] synthase II
MPLDRAAGVFVTAACAVTADTDGRLDESRLFPEKRSRKVGLLPEKARLVLSAASRCVPPSGLTPAGSGPAPDVGVSLGTLHGSMDAVELNLQTVRRDGFAQVTPSWYSVGLPNTTAAIVASVYGLGGPNLTFLGHQAGLDAIVGACRQIVLGRAATMLAGGFDLPTRFFAERLAASEHYPAGGARIHPGAGLLLVSRESTPDAPPVRIVGWSQRFHPGQELPVEMLDGMVRDAAANAAPSMLPRIHLVRPGGGIDTPDYLAASAPIHLIQQVIGQEAPGLHAIVAGGLGTGASCLVVEKG